MPITRKALPATILLAALFSACGRSSTPATRPAPATFPAGPRIISTVPAATLNLVLIGATDSLVGVSPYDVLYLPENKKSLPIIGDYNLDQLNLERLLQLKPTALIVQTAPEHIPQRLRDLAAAHHFDIVNIKLDTTADLWNTVRTLGRISGKENSAEAAVLSAQAQLHEIAQTFAGKTRPRVVYVIAKNPLDVVGNHNFMNETLTLAGADNIAAKIGNSFITISDETLVKLAPDVLLIGAPGQPVQQADDPRLIPWQRFPIPAVTAHRVFLVTDPDALTASVDLPKNVRSLAVLIHQAVSTTGGTP